MDSIRKSQQQCASRGLLNRSLHSHFDQSPQGDGSVRSGDRTLVDASPHTQLAIDMRESLEATPIGSGRAMRFPSLRAEHSLSTWFTRNSFLELRSMLRASMPNEPALLCLPPLGAPILQNTKMTFPIITHSPAEGDICKHLLISVESFLASLSLLEDLWNFTENCPSIPALYCDAILRQDQYRDSHELEIARAIMEHIDTHHASISHEVNIEIGAS